MAKHHPSRTRLKLRLYIAGNAPNSLRALSKLREICEAEFPSMHDLEVVDLLLSPERALKDGIIVTPTLLKLAPAPEARLIGDLRNTEQVRALLGGA